MNRRSTLVEAAGAGLVGEAATRVGRYSDDVGWPLRVTDTQVVDVDGMQAIGWHYKPDPDDLPWTKGQHVLDALLDLADVSPKGVAAFVRKYGQLEICSHGYSWYNHKCGEFQNPQPIETFHSISLEFGALLRLAAAGRRSQPGDLADWTLLGKIGHFHPMLPEKRDPAADWTLFGKIGDFRPMLPEKRDPAAARMVVSDWVSYWMQITPPNAILTWPSKDQIEFSLGSLGPLSAAAKELAFTIAQIDALAVCAECGKPFIPKRRRAQSRRAYCQKCGKQASDRRAQREKRARERVNKRKPK